eukprot:TRINITY_DN4122_c0_g1_i3.p1 TRINITY_DN4122_c0_g1~~TRINITY_DN4122_c0_g1_i3.p1  ORF type:complete len:472 (-),score=57.75 TRINITY_DN4122_c0_g1_i3:198-1613(-)
MILYETTKFSSFLSLQGSVIHLAVRRSLLSSLFGMMLKLLEQHGHIDLDDWNMFTEGSIYGSFTFVLGFTLVFRTSQGYGRYVLAAKSMIALRVQWLDACASLIAFSKCSRRPEPESVVFEQLLIRLFSMLHAVALEELATMENENFPVLDMEGLDQNTLQPLTEMESKRRGSHESRKTELIYQWIKLYTVQCAKSGILPIPAPILSRVFQMIGDGLVMYNDIIQVSSWPFPFPYAQLSAVMIILHFIITPLVMCQWTSHWIVTCLLTLVSCVSLASLDLISIEIENPLGDDPNDLPVHALHHGLNQLLLMLVNPATWRVPRLTTDANFDIGRNKARQPAQAADAVWEPQLGRTEPLKTYIASGCASEARGPAEVYFMHGMDTGPAKSLETAGVAEAPAIPSPDGVGAERWRELLDGFVASVEADRQKDLANFEVQQEQLRQRFLQSTSAALREAGWDPASTQAMQAQQGW